MVKEDHIHVVAIALIERADGCIVALQRAKNGMWTLPGGHVEVGEDIVSAAKREIREETGLIVDNLQIIGFTQAPRTSDEKHFIGFWLHGKTSSNEIENREPQTHKEVRWCKFEDIPKPWAGQLKTYWNGEF